MVIFIICQLSCCLVDLKPIIIIRDESYRLWIQSPTFKNLSMTQTFEQITNVDVWCETGENVIDMNLFLGFFFGYGLRFFFIFCKFSESGIPFSKLNQIFLTNQKLERFLQRGNSMNGLLSFSCQMLFWSDERRGVNRTWRRWINKWKYRANNSNNSTSMNEKNIENRLNVINK